MAGRQANGGGDGGERNVEQHKTLRETTKFDLSIKTKRSRERKVAPGAEIAAEIDPKTTIKRLLSMQR